MLDIQLYCLGLCGCINLFRHRGSHGCQVQLTKVPSLAYMSTPPAQGLDFLSSPFLVLATQASWPMVLLGPITLHVCERFRGAWGPREVTRCVMRRDWTTGLGKVYK